jgi:hypothetical protein
VATTVARIRRGRVTIQIRCPATAQTVCNGTVKLRTITRVRGARRTLGTMAFQAPAGRKRQVTFILSAAHARMLRGKRVSARVYVVARDTDGRSRTTTARLTLRG